VEFPSVEIQASDAALMRRWRLTELPLSRLPPPGGPPRVLH
jgi:hypothetical protein